MATSTDDNAAYGNSAKRNIRLIKADHTSTIPQVKSLCMRFCELCKRQNVTLEHFVCIRRDSEAEG